MLKICVDIYLINVLPELTFLSISSLMRMNDMNDEANKLYSLFYPLYNAISAPIFCFIFGM